MRTVGVWSLFVVLTLFSTPLQGDITLQYLCASDKGLRVTEKLWHNYIRSFLQKTLLSVEDDLMKKIFDLRHFEEKLQIWLSWFQMFKLAPEMPTIRSVEVKSGAENWTKRASGSMEISKSYTDALIRLQFTNNSMKDSWRFGAYQRLSFNLSFDHLYIFGAQEHCHTGMIRITPHPKADYGPKYCGQLATFSFYSMFSVIFMILDFKVNTSIGFYFKGSYSVMDKYDFMEVYTPYKGHQQFPDQQFLVVNLLLNRVNLFVATYFLQIEKVYKMSVHRPNDSFEQFAVVDGPGFLSPKLIPKGDLYVTSSFICIVQVMSERPPIADVKFLKLNHNRTRTISLLSTNKPAAVYSSKQYCSENPCLAWMYSNHHHQINVTLTSLQYKSTNGMPLECRFGAFVVVQGPESIRCKYREESPVCDLTPMNSFPKRSFYSKKPSLYVLLYWYEGYTDLSATFTVSTTKCKAVQIDFCVATLCVSQNDPKIPWDPHFCPQYFGNISEYHNIRVSFTPHQVSYVDAYNEIWKFSDAVHIRADTNMCYILQVRDEGIFNQTYSVCKMNYFVGNFAKETVSYTFSGTLKHLALKGNKESGFCQRNKDSPCEKAEQDHNITITHKDAFIKVTAKTPASRYQNLHCYFNFQTSLNMPSNAWVDVVMWSTPNPDKRDTEVISSRPISFCVLRKILDFTFNTLVLRAMWAVQGQNKSSASEHFLLSAKADQAHHTLAINLALKFSQITSIHHVQLHGHFKYPLSLEWLNTSDHTSGHQLTLFAFWLSSPHVNESLDLTRVIPHGCQPWARSFPSFANTSVCHPHQCSNFSIYTKYFQPRLLYHFLYKTYFEKPGEDCLFTFNTKSGKKLKSWTDASLLCKESSSFLPQFSSESQMTEFSVVLKIIQMTNTSVLEGVFIGLRLKDKTEVSGAMPVLEVIKEALLL